MLQHADMSDQADKSDLPLAYACYRCKERFISQSEAIIHQAFCPYHLPDNHRLLGEKVSQKLGPPSSVIVCEKCLRCFKSPAQVSSHREFCSGFSAGFCS